MHTEGEPVTMQKSDSEGETQKTLCIITDSARTHVHAAIAILLFTFLKRFNLNRSIRGAGVKSPRRVMDTRHQGTVAYIKLGC